MKLTQREEQIMLLCAFRYALGRRTYITSVIAEDILIPNWDEMKNFHGQIIDDINHAIDFDMAGDDCDVAVWKKVLKHAKGDK